GSAAIALFIGNPALLTASFTLSPSSGSTSTVFTMNASDSTSQSGIVDYSWDFGDNTALGSGVSVTHQYSANRTYTVRLTITDTQGRTATATKTVTIS